MSKKNINISEIKDPQIRNDGNIVRFDVVGGNNQVTSFTVSTEKLMGLIHGLMHIHMSAKVRNALPEIERAITEFAPMPTPCVVSDVNVVSFIESGGIAVEVHDIQGSAIHLHFQPQHFQFFTSVVEKINALTESSDKH